MGVPVIGATDVSQRAIEVAAFNASELNVVNRVEVRRGEFFCDLRGPFDVITANLSQEIIPSDHRATLSPLQAAAIDGGGSGGNAILLDFLEVAPRYMHPGTKLYIIVNTVTDYKATLQHISSRFQATLIWEGSARTKYKAFVRDNRAFFKALMDAGTVSVVEDASGEWHATQFIYRLMLKAG